MKRVHEEDIDFETQGIATYEGEAYTGEIVEHDENGNTISLVTYRDGEEDGPYLEWYPDGTPQVKGFIVSGKGPIGTWIKWHKNGQISQEQHFDDRGREVARRQWDEHGNVIKDSVYKNPI
ncbi:toxin-antitoxin system YwqK family antitoxin [Salinactinospora qingdaonensis]|uniref:MORN repeat variant n=1 Tax=Salinactinospora qingdaonensis TaxID=702744 RepID=A0ABP7FRH1_9ACTN